MDQLGLLLICRDDPISRLYTRITREPFSQIGFYYLDLDAESPNKSFDVLIFDLLDESGQIGGSRSTRLENLLKDPLISRIAFRELLGNSSVNRAENMRITATNVLLKLSSIKTDPNLFTPGSPFFRKIISQLLGIVLTEHQQFAESAPVSSLELVNQIFIEIEQWDAFHDPETVLSDETITAQGLNLIKGEANSVGSFLEEAAGQLRRLPVFHADPVFRSVRSYLTESRFFGPLTDLTLPARNPIFRDLASQEEMKRARPFLVGLTGTFIDLLISDNIFSQKTMIGLNNLREHQDNFLRHLYSMIQQLSEGHHHWIGLFNQILDHRIISTEQIRIMRERLSILLFSADPQLNLNTTLIPPSDLNRPRLITLLGSNQTIEESIDPKEIIGMLERMVREICQELNLGKTPSFNLNYLIHLVNRLKELSGDSTESLLPHLQVDGIERINIIGLIDSLDLSRKDFIEKTRETIPRPNNIILSSTTPIDLSILNYDQLSNLQNQLKSKDQTGSEINLLLSTIESELAKRSHQRS